MQNTGRYLDRFEITYYNFFLICTIIIILFIIINNTTGLEPKTVLSQWYPTANLYPNRPHEGMYLLRNLPGVEFYVVKLPPKPLVSGCKKIFDDLRVKINKHYRITDTNREKWNEWFSKHSPRDEDAVNYVRSHRYVCPLMQFFKYGIHNVPTSWQALLPVDFFFNFLRSHSSCLALCSIPIR